MVTTALTVIILITYIMMLVCKYKHTGNQALNAAVLFVQAILWCFIVVRNWNDSGKFIHIVYVVIISLTVIAGAQAIYKYGNKRKK